MEVPGINTCAVWVLEDILNKGSRMQEKKNQVFSIRFRPH